MTLIADANLPDPVIPALKAVQVPIRRIQEILPAITKDEDVIAALGDTGDILVTLDKGIPSPAYLQLLVESGVTVVLLRWNSSTPKDWQQMVQIILRDAALWEQKATGEPSVISVSYKRGSRVRPWREMPRRFTDQAKASQ